MSRLLVQGVSASYGTTRVLREVDLEVPAGTTTAILGASGCGKTTLLRVIAGFHRPEVGQVVIGERTVVRPGFALPAESRGIGYLAQEGNLFPHLSVAGNIRFGLSRQDRRDASTVASLLELVGLPATMADRRPDQLSGGQQQRVALARALARRPELVLLDEPFSSLDAGVRATTRRAVSEALSAAGATAVLVTHDQGEALSFADQVAIMRSGRFVQTGSPQQVYSGPVDQDAAGELGELTVLPGVCDDDRVTTALGALPASGSWHGRVDVALRPEQIVITEPRPGRPEGLVEAVEYFGHDVLVRLAVLGGTSQDPLVVQARVLGEDAPTAGQRVGIGVRGHARVFPAR